MEHLSALYTANVGDTYHVHVHSCFMSYLIRQTGQTKN